MITFLHSESSRNSSRQITLLPCVRSPTVYKIAYYPFNYYNCRSHLMLCFGQEIIVGAKREIFWLSSSITPKIARWSINSRSRKGLQRTVYGLTQYNTAAPAAKINQTSAVMSHAMGRAAVSWRGQLSFFLHKCLDFGDWSSLGKEELAVEHWNASAAAWGDTTVAEWWHSCMSHRGLWSSAPWVFPRR